MVCEANQVEGGGVNLQKEAWGKGGTYLLQNIAASLWFISLFSHVSCLCPAATNLCNSTN